MVVAGVGAGLLGGAIGGGLAVTVLAPLTAANNFLGSYFFGSGMILGERQMYQDDWIKIKKRLDEGESFLVILEEVMKPNTQAVMQMARETVIAVSAEWNDIVLKYLQSIPQSIWDAINKVNAGEATDNPWPLGDGVTGIINGKVQCADGWTEKNNKCILNSTLFPPTVAIPSPGSSQPKIPTHGQQPEIRKPVIQYPVSDAVRKLYSQFKRELAALIKHRSAAKASALAVRRLGGSAYKNALARIPAINDAISNKVNQIKALEQSYPNLLR